METYPLLSAKSARSRRFLDLFDIAARFGGRFQPFLPEDAQHMVRLFLCSLYAIRRLSARIMLPITGSCSYSSPAASQ